MIADDHPEMLKYFAEAKPFIEEIERQKQAMNKPLQKQVGGSHYKDLTIQPIEYIHANKLGFCEANVVKYVSRWRAKNGIADLEKAKHYIELLIELETKELK